MTRAAQALQARGVRMQFGGIVALEDASIEVPAGQVAGLIGRNGSGKSTLFNCITGFLRPTSGEISVDGRSVAGLAPHEIVRAGIARTFQTPRVDFKTCVREAVCCGLHASGRSSFVASMLGLPRARRDEARLRAAGEAAMARLAIDAYADAEIGTLSMGRVRLVEVARAMAAGARYLLLDEPAAGLSRAEQEVLALQIRRLADGGIGVLLVEHNFGLVKLLCDRVTVLDAGRVLRTGTPAEVERDATVLRVYLGVAAAEPMPAALAEAAA